MAGPVEQAIANELAAAPAWLLEQAKNLARQLDEGAVPNAKGGEPAPTWRAAVSKQLTALVQLSKVQPTAGSGSVVDEVNARRARRIANPAPAGDAAVVGDGGARSDRAVRRRRNGVLPGAEAGAG